MKKKGLPYGLEDIIKMLMDAQKAEGAKDSGDTEYDTAEELAQRMAYQISDADIIADFLRTYPYPFTIEEYLQMLKRDGVTLGKDECTAYLVNCDYVFSQNNRKFFTYSAAFTGMYFSIKPTKAETAQGMFVAGSRCYPFVDFTSGLCDLSFRYRGKMLNRAVGEFSSMDAVDMFALSGVEFAPQFIAADSANEDLDIAQSGYELPSKVRLSGYSFNLKAGDRLLCYVDDWSDGVIEIEKIEHASMQMRQSDIRRQSWYNKLEKALLASFDESGPANSIGSQLALVFMNNPALSAKSCGSVMEYLAQSKTVALEDYGVESRLWRKGEEVPAVGKWLRGKAGKKDKDSYEWILADFVYVPYFVIDAFIIDQLHRKTSDTNEVIQRLMLNKMPLKRKEMAELPSNIESRRKDLAKEYNYFADANTAPLRARALDLYIRARELVIDLFEENISLDEYPQKALIVFLQIFSTVTKTINMMTSGIMRANDDVAEFIGDGTETTLENMEGDFEGAEDMLRGTMKAKKPEDNSHGFVIIK